MRYIVENPFNLNSLNILNITSPRKYQGLQSSNYLFFAYIVSIDNVSRNFSIEKVVCFFKSFDI